MKVIAMYLPQFHRVKENDEWWGEGFTDWVAAQNAKPLFEGHYQPHVPLNNNYYNLLDKHTMEWQADLMHQYGVDGMCMYHYWFKDGRRILEKPAENLLEWTDIDMPFCFSWANETWARSWSKISEEYNAWNRLMEPQDMSEEPAVLLEQKYGDKEDWAKHFEYLVPFFKDERYIKIEGKPLFIIYKASKIACLGDMLECWRLLAKNEGFEDLYIIGSNCNRDSYKSLDAELIHEPVRSITRIQNSEGKWDSEVTKIDYGKAWNTVLGARASGEKTYYGGFVGFDTTPRKGSSGVVICDNTPEQFEYYLSELIAKNEAAGNDVVFINAWNEWGEGMHLEPDVKYGYRYLEAVNKAKNSYQNRIAFYRKNNTIEESEVRILQELKEKFEKNMNVLDSWLSLKENGVEISDYFERKKATNICIYGYGLLAKHLLKELYDSDITVIGIIDKQGNKIHTDVPVYLPSDELPQADLIVVTVPYYYHDVVGEVAKRVDCDMVSIEAIVLEMME